MKGLREEAIVLKTAAYREADKRVVLFTRAQGKLTGVARGAMKSRKRFAGVLEPLNIVRAEWADRAAGMVTLTSAVGVRIFAGFRENYALMTAGMYALELVDKLTEEHHPVESVYDGLGEVLRLLDAGHDAEVLVRAFELKLVSVLGFRPVLDRCAHTGQPLGDRIGFSADAGGAIRSEAFGALAHWRIRSETLVAMRALLVTPLAELGERVVLDAGVRRDLGEVLPGFVQTVSGKRLKSLALLEFERSV